MCQDSGVPPIYKLIKQKKHKISLKVSSDATWVKEKALALALNSGYHKWGMGNAGSSGSSSSSVSSVPTTKRRKHNSDSGSGKKKLKRDSIEHVGKSKTYKKQKYRGGY